MRRSVFSPKSAHLPAAQSPVPGLTAPLHFSRRGALFFGTFLFHFSIQTQFGLVYWILNGLCAHRAASGRIHNIHLK